MKTCPYCGIELYTHGHRVVACRRKLLGFKKLTPEFRETLGRFIERRYGDVENASEICKVDTTTMVEILTIEDRKTTIDVLDRICVWLLCAPITYYEEIGSIIPA